MTLRRRLRDAYAMPTHSVHSRTLRKGITRASIRSSVDCTLLFCTLPNERKKTMGKVQILAVLTMDGCHSSELYGKAYEDLRLDRCDIDKIRENALYHVTPDYSISMLDEWRKDNTNICYLAEATPDNSDYINGLLRMRVVDEIILYTVPFISGTGRHFFKSALPEARWTLSSQKSYSNGVYRSIYTRMETMK